MSLQSHTRNEHELDRLQCPMCQSPSLVTENGHMKCMACETAYPLSGGRPVLLRHDNPLFNPADYPAHSSPRTPRGRHFMPSASLNLARKRVLQVLAHTIGQNNVGPVTVLVVGAGVQRDSLEAQLGRAATVNVICVDIDVGADVDYFADAHDLPFRDGAIDAVVTTAVLEHVLDPSRVAAEITRVLRPGGYLYSELPFMQQVHEGAYDFTRFTLSGHRRLFNHFQEIDAGMVAGPGTALLWSLEHFTTAFFDHPRLRLLAKAVTRCLFFWVKHADRLLINRRAAMDGASCTYILGTKITHAVTDEEIIKRYVGAQRLSHH